MSRPPKYRIYPSLLDRFNEYRYIDAAIEKPWNADKTPSDVEAEIERGLLDAINRVPFESEAADRGTAFNEIVDCMIHGCQSKKIIPVYREIVALCDTGVGTKPELRPVGHTAEVVGISATYNNRTFTFPISLCREFADYFRGAASQVFCSGTLETQYGDVELYGYIDELIQDTVFDIKTTSRYEFGKFRMAWQKDVYPFCLEQMGCRIRGFEYTVTDFKNTYQEWYDFHYDDSRQRLREHCERFIEFLEARRDKITDKKIFNNA